MPEASCEVGDVGGCVERSVGGCGERSVGGVVVCVSVWGGGGRVFVEVQPCPRPPPEIISTDRDKIWGGPSNEV